MQNFILDISYDFATYEGKMFYFKNDKMKFREWLKEGIKDVPVFLRKNVYKLALFSCLLNLTNCQYTVPKQEAQQEFKEKVA